jgi:hypothetical protein
VPTKRQSWSRQNGERGKILDVGLEIRDGKDDVLGNEFLSVHREGKSE